MAEVNARPQPDFTVIVPSHGRPDGIRRCLAALELQDHPRDRFEVIVVDDAGVPAVAESPGVRVIRHATRKGPAAARNTGLAHATGRFVAFTDDDCRPEPGWLTGLAMALQEAPEALAGGSTVNGLGGSPWSVAGQVIHEMVHAHYNPPGKAYFFASNNMAASRAALAAVGSFDAGFPLPAAEDRELCDRWRASSRPLVFVPGARVTHFHGMSLGGFWRQHFRYGRGAWLYHKVRRERRSGRMWEESSFTLELFRLAWPQLAKRGFAGGAALAARMAVWQAANAAGFFFEASAARLQRRRPVPRS